MAEGIDGVLHRLIELAPIRSEAEANALHGIVTDHFHSAQTDENDAEAANENAAGDDTVTDNTTSRKGGHSK